MWDPQGGSIRVLLSHGSLHYVLDVWVATKRRKHLDGAAYWVRSLDDVVLCLPSRSDALRVHKRREERLQSLGWELAPEKTRLSECGRCAQRDAATQGKQRPETVSFLGFTHSCPRNRPGNCKVERRTARKR